MLAKAASYFIAAVSCLLLSSCKPDPTPPALTSTAETSTTTQSTSMPQMQEVNNDGLDPNRDRMDDYPRKLTDGKVSFKMTESRIAGVKYVRVLPTGLAGSNEEIELTVKGDVTHAELADLDGDGHSELMFFTRARRDSRDQRGYAIGLASNSGVSMTKIQLPPVTEYGTASNGYQGGDLYMIKDNLLLHKFPIYDGGKPTGKYRTLTYQMQTTGQSREFELVDSVEK